MQEIKFRAWDIKSKIMLDWNMINQTAFNTFNKLFEYDYYQKNYANDDNLKHKNLFSVSLLYTIFHDPNFILMQFTGLKDINDKDIYEGDIVEYKSTIESGKVVIAKMYDTCNLGFKWFEQKTDSPSSIDSVHYFGCAKELKIIGDIYRNPELLEGLK